MIKTVVENFRKSVRISMKSSITVSFFLWFVISLATGSNSQTEKPTLDSNHTQQQESGSRLPMNQINYDLDIVEVMHMDQDYYDTKIKCETRFSFDNKDNVKLCKYESGAIESETHFKDGKEEGISVGWYENGEKKYEISYNRGRLEGVEIQYYNTGSKLFEIRFKNDMKDGAELWWYENGTRRSESSYKEGKKEGIEKNWDERGNLTTKVWTNGVEEK